MRAILPYAWRCLEDAKSLDRELGPDAWARIRGEFSKRLELGLAPGTIKVGLSTFTEKDVEVLVAKTGEWGASTLMPDLPIVEHVPLDDPRLYVNGRKRGLFG